MGEISTGRLTAVLTGCAGAIGFETAVGLARSGWRTGLLAREASRAESVARRVRERVGPGCPEMIPFGADLSRQVEIRRAAEAIVAAFPALKLLVHNAGAITMERAITEDGVETQLAVHAVAPFLLTRLLLPSLRAGAPARVLVVASRAARQGELALDDLRFDRGYDGLAAYERSKLAATLFAFEAARRFAADRIAVHALHPGVVDSKLLADFGAVLRRRRAAGAGRIQRLREASWRACRAIGRALRPGRPAPGTIAPEAGARTTLWAAIAPELEGVTGAWLEDGRVGDAPAAATDRDLAAQFWSAAESLIAVPRGTRCS